MTFNEPVKRLLKRLLPYMPEPVLVAAIRRRPGLIDRVPAGQSIRWPHYQGDLTDVGANVGAVTLLMAKLVGPAGRVLAVEPGPPYVERLRANLALNSSLTDRVAVYNVGLSDAPGMLHWRPDPNTPFNAGLSAAHPDSVPGEVAVPVTTLDALVASQELDRLDFIKIDVEGMELEVMRGARRTLETLRPVLLFETLEMFRIKRRERTGIADVFAEIEGLLHDLGYRLFALRPDGKLEEVTSASLPDNTLGIPVRHGDRSYASGSVPHASS